MFRRLDDQEIAAASTNPAALAEKLGVTEALVTELLGDTLETGTSACLDVMHSPHPEDKGGECTASFMRCIGCPNAVVAPKHLLRLEALRDALVRAARSTHHKKAAAYGPHIARLEHLLGKFRSPN